MSLKNYKLLKGRVVDTKLDNDSSPHIEVLIEENGRKYRAAINVRSQEAPHALLYLRRPITAPQRVANLRNVADGIGNPAASLQLDYTSGFVDKTEMSVAPFRVEGPSNDLLEHIQPLLERAINDPQARIYVWGESWDEPGRPDSYFGFDHGRGIHDIHMNQGSSGGFSGSNGRNQDGALALDFGGDQFVEILLAFQTQSWVNDANGHPTSTAEPIPAPEPGQLGFLRIVAALVNAEGDEEGNESVTLINLSDGVANLHGWKIIDKEERAHVIGNQAIPAGETIRIFLRNARLGNKGGTIELRSADDTIVHLVSYTKNQASTEGWTVAF